MKKIVIYTVITGGYDNLVDPEVVEPGFDYVCFTDNVSGLKSDVWDIRPLPEWCLTVTPDKRQRMLKILAHLVFPEYKMSLYIDGNIKIVGELTSLAKEVFNDRKFKIAIQKHPVRNDIYNEAIEILKTRKDTPERVTRQTDRYFKEGFPVGEGGLFETCIMFRKHMTKDCIKLMEKWALEIMIGSHRDQLSLTYAMWKTGVKVEFLPSWLKTSNAFMISYGHIGERKRK